MCTLSISDKRLIDQSNRFLFCSVENFHRNESAQMNDERLLAKNKAELNALRANEATAREMSDGIFQLTVVDIANYVLRYHALMAQVRISFPLTSNGCVMLGAV